MAASSMGLNSPAPDEPTPRSWSRPLSPRTKARRRDPRGSTPPGLRLRYTSRARAFNPEGNVNFTPDTRTTSHWATRAGNTCDGRESSAKHPKDQPGTHAPVLAPGHEAFVNIKRSTTPQTEIAEGAKHQPGTPPTDAQPPRPSALDIASHIYPPRHYETTAFRVPTPLSWWGFLLPLGRTLVGTPGALMIMNKKGRKTKSSASRQFCGVASALPSSRQFCGVASAPLLDPAETSARGPRPPPWDPMILMGPHKIKRGFPRLVYMRFLFSLSSP